MKKTIKITKLVKTHRKTAQKSGKNEAKTPKTAKKSPKIGVPRTGGRRGFSSRHSDTQKAFFLAAALVIASVCIAAAVINVYQPHNEIEDGSVKETQISKNVEVEKPKSVEKQTAAPEAKTSTTLKDTTPAAKTSTSSTNTTPAAKTSPSSTSTTPAAKTSTSSTNANLAAKTSSSSTNASSVAKTSSSSTNTSPAAKTSSSSANTSSSRAAPTTNTAPAAHTTASANLGTLVFIIDDAGNNLRELEPFFSIPGPLTIAVLPGLPHSAEAARRIRAAGKEVFLHQPMEAIGAQNPGPGAIYCGMGADEIRAILKRNVAEVGPVAGINNHQGSKVTMDREAMKTILSFCAENNLRFLDSRTTAETVVPEVARELGIIIGERNIFLDNEQNREAMSGYLSNGLTRAQKNGSAVMIGHTWSPALAPLLAEQFPLLTKQGYTIKSASDMIK